MTLNSAQNFIAALDPQRDRLYALASAASPRPEMALLAALHAAFAQYEKDQAVDPVAAIEKALPVSPEIENHKSNIENLPMPADIWARLVAAVQVEAARSSQSCAINPDSVLLSPDPLLAPKKPAAGPSDSEGFDLPPTSRFLLAGVLVILLAIGLTVYLLTRPATPPVATQPATTATAPAF